MKGGISKARKATLFARDGGRCQYCGVQMQDRSEATVDHIIPVSLGGSGDMENLRLSCRPCNSTKQDRSVEWLRLFRALSQTKYGNVITLAQYHQLLSLGVQLEPLPVRPFYFEAAE